MRLAARPSIYEINTAVWLERLGRERGRPLELGEVPGSEWDRLARLPVDAAWLMGVWERSPAGREAALADAGLRAAYQSVLSDFGDEDVIGSPYCVHDYLVDQRFGGAGAVAAARRALAERGLGLILDYVPNHLASDHRWVTERPQYFLAGTDEELRCRPDEFMDTPGGVLAKAREPYSPPWQDVLQLNAYSPEVREATTQTLLAIAAQCDGVRCDMAMLMINETFARTWGERGGSPPEADFWPLVIGRVKQSYPDFAFIAEVYWDLEWTLQQQGFDLCYDKRLYDRLAHACAKPVHEHLRADLSYQEGLVRFIENHDEPRAASTFGPAQARAAAVVMSTLPGARLYHDGQFEGRRKRIPVQLARGAEEAIDGDLLAFYERLVRAISDADLRRGRWSLCERVEWPHDESGGQLLAWCWSSPQTRELVVVNFSEAPTRAWLRLPWADVARRAWTLTDRLTGERFARRGDDLADAGLYVALDGCASSFLAFESAGR